MQTIEQKILETLHNKFHLPSLYPYQELVIRTILERGGLFGRQAALKAPKEQIVVLPTGSGKSVCFMLPALLLPGITLAIYPLLSLMNDQARRVEDVGSKAVILRGGQSDEERAAIWRQLDSGESRFIITNPETLKNKVVLKRLTKLKISLVVIDEVHTVTQWGDTFRPSYLELRSMIKQLSPRQITAFTATASPRIIERITHILFDGKPPYIVKGDPDRPNISYRVLPSLCKIHDLQMLTSYSIQLPAVAFCSSRDRCETYAWELTRRNPHLPVRYYHAGLDKKEREATERWFFHADDALLISTSAYGMGIDKKNIRTVIHINLSSDVESFLQESGRAGRDGKPAFSIVLIGKEEEKERHQCSMLLELFQQKTICRREALLQLMGFPNDTCSGCDVCNGQVVSNPDGMEEILRLCRRYPFRYTINGCAHLLHGSASLRDCPPIDRANPYFGILRTWEVEDIAQAAKTLIEVKRLHSCTASILRGRLVTKRTPKLP